MASNGDSSTILTGRVGKPIRHLHHFGEWFEYVTEPIENRIAYIRESKPEHEVETRLRLLKPVTGKLPEAVVVAAAAEAAAYKTFDAAKAAVWETYDAAEAAANKTYDAAMEAARETYDAAKAAARETSCAAEAAAHKTYGFARARYSDALEAHRTEIDAQHWQECGQYGCPWTPKNRTIFPEDGNGK